MGFRKSTFKADGKNCGPGPRKIKVRLNSQIYLVCPNMATVLQPRDTDVQTSDMWENIWLLRNKAVFDHCDVAHFPLPKRDKNLFICNNPTGLVFVSLLFLEFSAGIDDITFQGGNTYYLMDRTCNSKNIGILTCPPPATTRPHTTPPYTTMSKHGNNLGINTPNPTVPEKSVTQSKSTRTQANQRRTKITRERTTETIRPASPTNEATQENRIGESGEVAMYKSRYLGMAIAQGISCSVVVLIVILGVCKYCSGQKKCSLALPMIKKTPKSRRGISEGGNSAETRGNVSENTANLPSSQ
ncbi:PREDICTED: uncharacterized protein LOC107344149 isoform X4 [Acropora digitifera]|uniref:uncharacterized protein LOC107344149 isoform X4 n=1 Tax=Acropora digitifera TaxID=70779 RepID=UPI00077A2FC9|nr:PREDICTED: uncharacterized protein LOC107344149 isoform X4 [Acropora digitifera]